LDFVDINPNPANSYVNIQSNISGPLQLSFFNAIGQLVKTEKLYSPIFPASKRVYLGYLPSGIYFIRISGGKQMFTKRILIQH